MNKKQLILYSLLFAYILPSQAQNARISLDYQSFRPFIHFQLNVGNDPYRSFQDGYRSAYMKGYMDGVNDARYYRHRFAAMVHDFRMYETGYRDGFRDRELLIRLRGRSWYQRHRFGYDDYYAPTYSVRIWLSNLSMAFIQAPSRRLPRHWKGRAHPRFKKYRRWYKRSRYRDDDYDEYDDYDDDDYRGYARLERSYNQHVQRYRRQAQRIKKRSRQQSDYKRNGRNRGRFKSKEEAQSYIRRTNNNRRAVRDSQNKRRPHIQKQQKQRREAVDKRQKRRPKKVRKTRSRSRKNDKVDRR
ncbi:MAG TPA: hypothetical protein VK112_07350, partial [Fodinibius sp.]|nr:hypothetical protein [Fodinibius sp.]